MKLSLPRTILISFLLVTFAGVTAVTAQNSSASYGYTGYTRNTATPSTRHVPTPPVAAPVATAAPGPTFSTAPNQTLPTHVQTLISGVSSPVMVPPASGSGGSSTLGAILGIGAVVMVGIIGFLAIRWKAGRDRSPKSGDANADQRSGNDSSPTTNTGSNNEETDFPQQAEDVVALQSFATQGAMVTPKVVANRDGIASVPGHPSSATQGSTPHTAGPLFKHQSRTVVDDRVPFVEAVAVSGSQEIQVAQLVVVEP